MEHTSPIIAPSILSANFGNFRDGLKDIETSDADWVHFDVMDGHFVPNITFGPKVIADLRPYSQLVFDVHLMISNPEEHIDMFISAGADNIIFHIETQIHVHRLISFIREKGKSPGISIVPSTPISVCTDVLPLVDQVLVMSVNPGFGGQKFIDQSKDKIQLLAEIRKQRKLSYLISVDGGIDTRTSRIVLEAGADVLVSGSSFFTSENKHSFVTQLRER